MVASHSLDANQPDEPDSDFFASWRDRITCLEGKHVVLIDHMPVLLTPTEYAIMRELVTRFTSPVSFRVLTRAAFDRPDTLDTRRLLERHIDRIRLKLRDDSLSIQLAVRYVNDCGYVLLPRAW